MIKPTTKPTDGRIVSSPKNAQKSAIMNQTPNTKSGDNAKFASLMLEIANWGEVDKKNVDQLEERFIKYIQLCMDNDMKIGNQACYFALGITKDDVYDWEHGKRGTPRHADFVKKVRKFCSSYREYLMQDGKINPVVGIFWQKNYDGMKDQQDLIVTPNQIVGNTDVSTIAEKYKELPEDTE